MQIHLQWGLTFDMSGGPRGAKRPLERPLDGGVRRHVWSSRRTLGCLTATLSSVRAAPVGSRRPCSQSCSVRADTPRSTANSCCDKPTLARASATADNFTLLTRAAWPRCICLTDSSRSSWNFLSSDGILDSLFQLCDE